MVIHIGTSGWVYPHWRGIFYPQDLPQPAWFDFFAHHFDTVEINNTFYRLPGAGTSAAWSKQAPPGFRYSVKANRYLTHLKKLKPPADGLDRFFSRARRLGTSLGPILWQLPPGWHANPDRLRDHAGRLPHELTHVFEFRDPDWFQGRVRRTLELHQLTFGIYDMVGHECPLWVTSPTVYLRFHGPAVEYGGQYGEGRLGVWIDRIRSWSSEGLDVYAYFNNDLGGFAVEDALRLRRMVAGSWGKSELSARLALQCLECQGKGVVRVAAMMFFVEKVPIGDVELWEGHVGEQAAIDSSQVHAVHQVPAQSFAVHLGAAGDEGFGFAELGPGQVDGFVQRARRHRA